MPIASPLFERPLTPPRWALGIASLVLPDVVFSADTTEPVIALTLDDGPHPHLTPRVLDVLAQHGARATFFLIGSRAERHGAVVGRIADEGHELGNHSWDHASSARLSRARLGESVRRTRDVLESYGPTRLFRPGSGWPTPTVLHVARHQGYRCVLGSIYPNDVRVRATDRIVEHVAEEARPGAILVLHEGAAGRERVVTILARALPELDQRGFRVTTVSTLLEGGASSAG